MEKKILTILFAGFFIFMVAPLAEAAILSGKANFTGTAPDPKKISMDADPSCAALHSSPVMTESLVTNDNGTLRNVFVYVKEGLEGQTFDIPKEPVTMDQKGCQYFPHVFGVQVKQTVLIINSDSTLHNVHGMPKNSKQFNLGMPIKGMKVKRKFDKPEVMVKFKCDVHPWMNAYAGVLAHPFYSVSGADGSYEIKDLPAGTYTIEAWHETLGTQTQQVTVDEAGAQTVDFTFA